MEIILLTDLDKVGDKYDVVTVKNGFGRNYLIPQKKAIIANEINMKRLADFKSREAADEAQKVGDYQKIADQLKDKVLKIGAKAGTSGKIFGSVTGIQLSAALKEQFGVDIPRKKINLPDDVKVLGAYTAELKLHPDVISSIAFEVVIFSGKIKMNLCFKFPNILLLFIIQQKLENLISIYTLKIQLLVVTLEILHWIISACVSAFQICL